MSKKEKIVNEEKEIAEELEEMEEEKESDAQEEISEEQRIAELEGQIAILKNEYAKAYADTENTKKRLQSEYDQLKKYHIQSFALEILPVLDNCERALSQETSDEAYKKGVEMIYMQLKAALEKEGVTEIEAEGEVFDGNWHQALMAEHRDDVEAGRVLEVLQKGYKLKDRILRAALVKVSE
ncbi:MAG: nucleotide exchange factor GrpE [Solobacterium sp.]|nr:nucleotide exchange factor GrpE [Solobacterium sp.]